MVDFGYVHRESFVHRLDPRIKLLWFVVVTLVLTTWLDPLYVLALYASVLAWAALARLDLWQLVRGLRPALPIVIVVFLLNLLMHEAPENARLLGHLIPRVGSLGPFVPVTLETLVFTAGLLLRLFVILTSVMVLMRILSPTEMALALVRLRLPAEVGMAFSIAIAYVPVLVNQIRGVLEAQQSRGWRVRTHNPVRRFRAFLPVMIPTFFRSYVASEEMAAAMLSRGFGYDMRIRTELHPRTFSAADRALLVGLLAFAVLGMTVGLLGYTDYTFTLRVLVGAPE